MNCEQANRLLSEFYDGELKEPLISEVADHVAGCKACSMELASFKMLSGMIKPGDDAWQSTLASAPTWHQFVTRSGVTDKDTRVGTSFASRGKLLLLSSVVLAASILFLVSLNAWINSGSVTHEHNHSHTGDSAVVIDFEKLLHEESNQPVATLVSLSNRFEGHEANLVESESQLGYKPSISRALPSDVELVSNRVLKLPHCNCDTGACTCGPAGCNCAASLCKRADGSAFLVVEHCATQNVSFGHLKSEVLRDGRSEIQMMSTGTRFLASWIASNRRLTAIGLQDKAEAQSIAASIAAH